MLCGNNMVDAGEIYPQSVWLFAVSINAHQWRYFRNLWALWDVENRVVIAGGAGLKGTKR